MKVINTHHFGSVEKLPSNVVYIGRPSVYGNSYSSKSGKYSKEECVALHRIDLYKNLIEDKSLLSKIKDDLNDKDLACWCKHTKRFFVCHGDNYLHILSDEFNNRDYSKSVIAYLMEDLRSVIVKLSNRFMSLNTSDKDWFRLYIGLQDAKVDIGYILFECKLFKLPIYDVCVLVANIVIQLEATVDESDSDIIDYRILYVLWIIFKFINPEAGKYGKPNHPSNILKSTKKIKK